MLSGNHVRVQFILDPERHEFLFITNEDLFESMIISLIDLEDDIAKQRVCAQILHVLLGLGNRTG
ncbi:hypothetical protein D3C87_2077750 [compost metagenome]